MTPTAHPHPASLDQQALLHDCQMRRYRDTGPGGQHRNKVETAVTLCHRPTGLTGTGRARRSQAQNLKTAVFRLRINLAVSVRCPIPSNHQPSALWRSRCVAGRVAINPAHSDFPSLLAEAMDVIASTDADLQPAATDLGCSVSQLVKLLRKDRRALGWLNERRQQAGLKPLR